MANIKDIAKLAGVSKSTVSRVVSNKGFVKPETREKIEAVMKELNYRPNMFAKGMRTNKSQSIGILFPDLANPFFAEWYEIVDKISRKQGYLNYICITDPKGETEETRIDDLLNRSIDGIIFFSYTKNEALWIKLENVSKHTPIVCCDSMFADSGLSCVYADGRKGTYDATMSLYKSGRRRIAYVKGKEEFPVVQNRFLGYCDALEETGISLDNSLIYEGEFLQECGTKAAAQFMELASPPDAIMASTDLMAMGVLNHLSTIGVKVPQEIAVFGYDNLKVSQTANPPLSTISLPIKDLAEKSINSLMELINEPDGSYIKHVFDCELKYREST